MYATISRSLSEPVPGLKLETPAKEYISPAIINGALRHHVISNLEYNLFVP